jgi:hypothetical protein
MEARDPAFPTERTSQDLAAQSWPHETLEPHLVDVGDENLDRATSMAECFCSLSYEHVSPLRNDALYIYSVVLLGKVWRGWRY